MGTLRSGHGVGNGVPFVMRTNQTGANGLNLGEGISPTLGSQEQPPAVAFRVSSNQGAWETGGRIDALTTGTDRTGHVVAHTLRADGFDAGEDGTGRGTPLIPGPSSVRRLTPTECEALMGWPRDWTRYSVNLKGKTVEQKDGPRYKQCGNGVAKPHAEWIARRLKAVFDS